MSNKKLLRAAAMRARSEISDKDDKNAAITDKLTGLLKQLAAKTVFTYVSRKDETDTKKFICKLFGDLKIYVPVTKNLDMTPYRLREAENLDCDSRGNISATQTVFDGAERFDVTVAPMLLFNSGLYRLGYGGGCYDRYFFKDGNTVKIGLAFSGQYSSERFEEDFDIPLDYIVTEDKIYRRSE